MAESQFRGIFNFLEKLGFFDVVLPFLLIFTIVFALLERTKVLGVETIDGKHYTKKNLNTMAAFVIAFLVVASSRLVEIITTVSSQFVVILFLIVLFLLLAGSFHMEKQEAFFLTGGWKTLFMVIAFVSISVIFLDATDYLDDTFGFLTGADRGEVTGTAILFIVIIVFIIYVTQDKQGHGQSKH